MSASLDEVFQEMKQTLETKLVAMHTRQSDIMPEIPPICFYEALAGRESSTECDESWNEWFDWCGSVEMETFNANCDPVWQAYN